MRILDVGCGDGSIGVWICEQLAGQGHAVEYIGCDLDEKMAESAAGRLADTGTLGWTQACDAHQAPPGPFDAILCFELLEHVADPQVLLDALEQRLAPGGVIYLSTPNGTFGAGNNPHHLRVYDLEGLLDLLRRRGQLMDGIAGGDGVAVAAYRPEPRRGDVAIYLGTSWERWAPWDIDTRGLGGSETAAVKLGEALSLRGWVVTVYADCERTLIGEHGLLFEHFSAFDPARRREAVIASRLPELFDKRLNTNRRILWMHDVDCGDRLTPDRAKRMEAIVVLSDWHHGHVSARYPFVDNSKFVLARNGIDPSLFDDRSQWSDRERRAVYSSSPDRGLDIILEAWPKVRELVPDAQLTATYAPVYHKAAEAMAPLAAFREYVKGLSDQPGVTVLDGLSQPELAKLMGRSRAWLAPSWMGVLGEPFHETYCIGAIEAAAAGCSRVGSPWGALKERGLEHYVGHAAGPPERPDLERWAKTIARVLKDDKGPPPAARDEAIEQTWDGVAEIFETVIGQGDPWQRSEVLALTGRT